MDTSLPSLRVIRVLDEIAAKRCLPKVIRTDNGPEFTSRRFLSWSVEKTVRATTIQPGKPIQNARIESFNGRFRDECPNVSWFQNLDDARRKIGQWRHEYNCVRPHTSLDYQTPETFAHSNEEKREREFLLSGETKTDSTIIEFSKPENLICPW